MDHDFGSQSYHEISCVLCDEDGRHVEASTYCTECRLYLCLSCVRLHQRFPGNRTHDLVDSNQGNSNVTSVSFGPSSSNTSLLVSSDACSLGTVISTHPPTELKKRQENHETRALEIEKTREMVGKREEQALRDLLLLPMNIPTVSRNLESYVVGGVKLCLTGDEGLFKYGKGVYDIKLFTTIIKDRMAEFARYSRGIVLASHGHFSTRSPKDLRYVVYNARQHGVSRCELQQVLHASQVGEISDPPIEECYRRMRDEIYEMVEDEDYVSNLKMPYRRQLFRWLANIQANLSRHRQRPSATDPNLQIFPLPEDVRKEIDTLRVWEDDDYDDIDDFRGWDDDVTVTRQSEDDDDDDDDDISYDSDGDSKNKKDTVDGPIDPHEYFVELCASHVDKYIPPLDMEINGDVPWKETEKDLVKNDTVTKDQQKLLEARAKRKPLDPSGIKRKREKLNEQLISKYGKKDCKSANDFELMCGHLERGWKEFEEICK